VTQVWTYPMWMSATNSAWTSSVINFIFAVDSPIPIAVAPVVLVTSSPIYLSWATVNEDLSFYVTSTWVNITSYTLTWALPAWLSFNTTSWVISWTVTQVWIYSMWISATNSVWTSNVSNFDLIINPSAQGQLLLDSSSVSSKILLAGNTAEKLMSFRIQARNAAIKLSDLIFNWANLWGLSNFKILDINWNTIALGNYIPALKQVSFTNINTTDIILKDAIKTYYLVADVNLNTSAIWINLTLDWTASKVKWLTNPYPIVAMTWVKSIASATHRIEQNMAVLAKEINTSANLATSALRFSVSVTGKNQVTVKNITLNTSISNYTGATDITVYKDFINAASIVGTYSGTTLNGNWIVIQFTANNIVNAGIVNHYIVVVNWAVINWLSPATWSISMTDATINLGGTNWDISLSTYSNMATLPITQIK